MDHRMLCI